MNGEVECPPSSTSLSYTLPAQPSTPPTTHVLSTHVVDHDLLVQIGRKSSLFPNYTACGDPARSSRKLDEIDLSTGRRKHSEWGETEGPRMPAGYARLDVGEPELRSGQGPVEIRAARGMSEAQRRRLMIMSEARFELVRGREAELNEEEQQERRRCMELSTQGRRLLRSRQQKRGDNDVDDQFVGWDGERVAVERKFSELRTMRENVEKEILMWKRMAGGVDAEGH